MDLPAHNPLDEVFHKPDACDPGSIDGGISDAEQDGGGDEESIARHGTSPGLRMRHYARARGGFATVGSRSMIMAGLRARQHL